MGYFSVRAELAASDGGRIQVIEAVRPDQVPAGGYYPALLNLGLGIAGLAASAKVNSRGPDGVAQEIMGGRSRYLVARYVAANAASVSVGAESQILAAARVKPTQNMPMPGNFVRRSRQVPFVKIEVLEVAGDGLLPTGGAELDEHGQRCRDAAAGILFALAAETGMEGGFVQVTGRYGYDFHGTVGDPRDPEYFSGFGFRQPDGAPAWGAQGGVMVAPAQLIKQSVIRMYGPALQTA